MKGSQIAAQVVEPYAEALMGVAQKYQATEAVGDDLSTLLKLLESSPELRGVISSPLIKAEGKKAVLQKILGEGSNPYLRNFLMLLVDQGRIAFLEQVAQKYLELLRKLNNIVLAVVTSAVELSPDQEEAVKQNIKSLTQAAGVELKKDIDPDLIGGVIIRVGSQVYDASLRGQLRRLSLGIVK